MEFNEYLINLKNKADSFFNTDAQCYDSGKDSQLLLYNNVEKEAFYKLLSQYEKKKIFDNIIENNEFFFFFEDGVLLSFGYYSCDKSVRISIDGKTALPQYEKEEYTNKGETTLWQFEVDLT